MGKNKKKSPIVLLITIFIFIIFIFLLIFISKEFSENNNMFYILLLPFLLMIAPVSLYINYSYYLKREIPQFKKIIISGKISQIDKLTPYEFEEWIAKIMCLLGYEAYPTKKSGDFGVDVIAERGDEKIGIQVKHFNNPVGVKAVQEVIAGMKYYNCNKAYVITSSMSFTDAAKNLALKSDVDLYTREDIAKLLKRLKDSNMLR